MRACFAMLLSVVALGVSGCAGYRLGPTDGSVAGSRTVQILPLANKTLEPRLGDAVTSAIRKELQRDGTFRLASRDAGEIIVSGEITEYRRNELSFLPNDVITVQDYRVRMTAQVTARERATGKILFNKPVTGYSLVRVQSDLGSVERQSLPLLAADVAKQVVSLLADGSW